MSEPVATLPTKWVICGACNGEGHVCHPAFENGITQSEMAEWHEDEIRHYFAGEYDVNCEECKATGKVRILDPSRMTFAQKREAVLIRQEAREEAMARREMDADVRAERAMGC